MLKNIARNERTVSFDVVEIATMWLSTSLNSALYVVNAVNLLADSQQTRELSNIDKGVKKDNLLAFMPKIMYFCLCKTLSTVK